VFASTTTSKQEMTAQKIINGVLEMAGKLDIFVEIVSGLT